MELFAETSRSLTPSSAGAPTLFVDRTGDGPRDRVLRGWDLLGPARGDAARDAGARAGLPCHARRDVGARRLCRRTWRPCAGGASTSSSRRRAASPAATSGAGTASGDRRIVAAAARSSPPPGTRARAHLSAFGPARARHRRGHPRAHRPGPLPLQPLLGAPGPRPRRGRGRARRRGHPRDGIRACRCARDRGGRGRDRGRDGRCRARAGRDGRPRRHGGGRRRLPPAPSWRPKLHKADGVPEIRLVPTVDILAELGAGAGVRPGAGRLRRRDRTRSPSGRRPSSRPRTWTCSSPTTSRGRASGSGTRPTP